MKKLDEYLNDLSNLILGGLVAISLIIFQDLISSSNLDIPTRVSIIAFAIAIPMIVFSLLIRQVPRSETRNGKTYNSMNIVTLIGIISDIVGVTATFFHVMLAAGIVFLISGFVGFSIYVNVERDIRDKLRMEESQKSDSL